MTINEQPTSPIGNTAATGWECPRCHATYAPWMASCTACKPPADSLRERIAYPQAPTPPAAPYAPTPYPAVPWVWPSPRWPWQDRIIWCDTSANPGVTLTLQYGVNYELDIRDARVANETWTLNRAREETQKRRDDDDGTAADRIAHVLYEPTRLGRDLSAARWHHRIHLLPHRLIKPLCDRYERRLTGEG